MADPDLKPISPWPVPGSSRAPVVLFGGSFDPPHNGHIELGITARDAADSSSKEGGWIVFVPAGRSPFKDKSPVASGADRRDMLQAAIAGVPRAAVWMDEVERQPGNGDDNQISVSYWVDTLRRAKAVAPTASLRFVLGADQAVVFHKWREPREILRLATPMVLLRSPVDSIEALATELRRAGFWSEPEIAAWGSWAVRLPLRDVSSTAVRAALRNRDAADIESTSLNEWVPAGVRRIIEERRLYRASS